MTQDNVATVEVPVTRRVSRSGALICLLGVDASGKSRQAAALAEALLADGTNAVHLRGRPRSARARAGRRPSPGRDRGEVSSPRPRGALRKGALRKHTALLAQAWRALFAVRVPLLLGKTIVTDQCVYDTLIDLSFCLDCSPDELLKEPLLRLCPRPHLSILLDLDPGALAARTDARTAPERERELCRRYLCLGSAAGMEEINAGFSPAAVQGEIRKRVWKRLAI